MSYVLIFILICFSAFFSGTEIAYTCLLYTSDAADE